MLCIARGRGLEHLQRQSLTGKLLCGVGLLGGVEDVPQHQHLAYIENSHLDGNAAGVQRTFLCAAAEDDIGQRRAGGVLVMGQKDDLRTGGFGRAESLHHIAGRTGVGDKEDDVGLVHQAGGQQLQVAVAGGAELGGEAGEAGADVVGQQHTAALSEAEDLLGLPEHPCGLIHGLDREGVLGAVDGGEETGTGVFKERLGGSPGLKLPLAGHGAGGVGLRQRNAHLVVAVEPERPAEPEHRGLGDVALPGQRGNGKILRLIGVL